MVTEVSLETCSVNPETDEAELLDLSIAREGEECYCFPYSGDCFAHQGMALTPAEARGVYEVLKLYHEQGIQSFRKVSD